MKRRTFIKSVVAGVAGVVAAPLVAKIPIVEEFPSVSFTVSGLINKEDSITLLDELGKEVIKLDGTPSDIHINNEGIDREYREDAIILFDESGKEAMRFNSSSKLVIGTDTPKSKLHVNTNTRII